MNPKSSQKSRVRCQGSKVKGQMSGTSLLEVLIYVAIFSIIIVFLTSIFPIILRSRERAEVQSEVQENLRFSIEKIQQSLLASSYVSTSGTCPLNIISIGIGSSTTTYQVVSDVLKITEGTNPAADITSSKVIVAGIDDNTCIFTKITNPSPAKSTVQIKMKISYNDQGKPELKFSDSTQITISLR